MSTAKQPHRGIGIIPLGQLEIPKIVICSSLRICPPLVKTPSAQKYGPTYAAQGAAESLKFSVILPNRQLG